MTYDCVVIGAGLAGLTAALRIAESGRRVVALAKGAGSLHLGGATIDILGYGPRRVESPRGELPAFVSENPDHPYARVSSELITESVEWLKERAPFLTGTLDHNFLLPTAVGAIRPSAIVPASIATGNLAGGGRLVLAGFSVLKDFYPTLAAANLSRHPDVTARAVMLDVSPLPGEADVGALAFARAFEDAEWRKTVLRALEGGFDRGEQVGFPAVLGLAGAGTVWDELQDGLGTDVFEIPTVPPSVPGIRLHDRLGAALRAAGGRVITGAVAVGANKTGNRVESVTVDTGGRTRSFRAESFVLATGGASAGGVIMDSHRRITEPVFDLPVAYAMGAGSFSPEYFAHHPVGRAGVAVDVSLRPVNVAGDAVYDNLHVCGATLGGAEPWKEKSGNGISLVTGYAAAESIVHEGK